MTRARILLTTAGRKAYLARLLKASRGCGTVVAVDLDPNSPMRLHADRFETVPPVTDAAGFVDSIHTLCLEEEIHCVLPQNDRELGLLASARGRFDKDGIRIAGLEPGLVEVVTDKFALSGWLSERGYPAPETWLEHPPEADRGEPGSRFVEKSRRGQGSEGLAYHERLPDTPLGEDKVVQRRLEGEEYNLDILRDGDGDVVAVSVKKKLQMLGGSTDRAVSIRSQELTRLGVRLAEDLDLFGSIDVDLIVCNDRPYVIDINPRIGGGFPFTALYYPAYVDALLEVCTGAPVGPRFPPYPHGVLVCREYTFSSTKLAPACKVDVPRIKGVD